MPVTAKEPAAFALRWSGVVIFILLWEAAPRLGWIDAAFAPPFSTVAAQLGIMAWDGTLVNHLLISAWRGLVGLLTALAVGIPAGFFLGRWFVRTGEAMGPLLRLLSQVNPFTLLPLFLLFFGIGETAKIAVVGWVSLWPILFYTVTAARTVEPNLVKTALSLGIGPRTLFFKVLLPAALPTLFTGVRIGAGLVFFMLVAAEMLGANAGVGWLVHNSAMNYQVSRMYAGALCIVILGYVLNKGLTYLEMALLDYREPSGAVLTNIEAPLHRRPGKLAVILTAVAVVGFIVLGGREVRRINVETTEATHARHDHASFFPLKARVESGSQH